MPALDLSLQSLRKLDPLRLQRRSHDFEYARSAHWLLGSLLESAILSDTRAEYVESYGARRHRGRQLRIA